MDFKRPLLCLTTIAALTSGVASADQPSFSYVEAGYTRVNLDDIDVDPDGYYIEGSIALGESGFLRASYSDLEDDILGLDVETEALSVGIGYRQELGSNSSWYVVADYLEGEVDVEGIGDADADGYQLATGVRGFVADSVEMGVEIGYADVDDADGFLGTINLLYHFSESLALKAEAGLDEEDNSEVSLGLRFNF